MQTQSMLISCADCGCLVDRGEVVTPCSHYPACCCAELPSRTTQPTANRRLRHRA
jgi:hypothetical protein